MEKEHTRERKLPAFSLSIGDLEALWSRLTGLFPADPTGIYSSIEIRLPSVKLKFANLEELKQSKDLPSRITNFWIHLSQGGRSLIIYSQRGRATVSATAETVAWCAGATETVLSFVQSYKLWYSWFLSTTTYLVLFIMVNVPAIVSISTGGHPEKLYPVLATHTVVFWAGWFGFFLALMVLWGLNEHVLPSAVIRTSESEGFIQKHGTMPTLVFTAVAAIATAVLAYVAVFGGSAGK